MGVAIDRASLRPLTVERTAGAIAAGDLSRGYLTRIRTPRSAGWGVAEHDAVPDRVVVLGPGPVRGGRAALRGADAPVRRGRQPRAAHAAHRDARLRRVLPAAGRDTRRRSRPDASLITAEVGHELGSHSQLTRADMDRIMQRVEQESARMGVLVEDMLLLARLDQQRPIEHRPVDLLTLAADAVQDARIIAPDREITLDVGSGTAFLILGDEVRLRQVIGNLMNNALTHTPEGTPVAVRVLAGPRQPVPSVVLEVADQGEGLRQDQAEHVFERFYRADQARTRKAGGTGLGLAIVAAWSRRTTAPSH